MPVFDMRGQTVTNQYNAAGNISFGAIQHNYELAAELDKIKQEVTRAREANAIDEDTETLAKFELIQAAKVAKAALPDKTILLERLSSAKDVLKGVAVTDPFGVGGIYEAITKAYDWAEKML